MSDDQRPPIGARVMWRYGRKDYAEYGEIGTVTEHDPDGVQYTVVMDDEQPFHRSCFGAKSKRTGWTRSVRFSTDRVALLADTYRENAARLRRVADDWDRLASEVQ